MRTYSCSNCGTRIHFENHLCLQCGAQLGYLPDDDVMLAIDSGPPTAAVSCSNRNSAAQCNWLLPAQDVSGMCGCCRFTRTIPPQDQDAGRVAWRRLERAKRYVFAWLLQHGLPLIGRSEDPEHGLVFDFLVPFPDTEPVITGHANGVISINALEADPVERERQREELGERYRTVLGHVRHEIGHYYWTRLIEGTPRLDEFRALFGDETRDYACTLGNYYQTPDDGGWRDRFISRYASAHPLEDWAETWAHYLLISDSLDTAAHWQLRVGAFPDSPVALNQPVGKMRSETFRRWLILKWLPLSQYLNASCRAFGTLDAYPFVLPAPVIDKLVFIHRLLLPLRRA